MAGAAAASPIRAAAAAALEMEQRLQRIVDTDWVATLRVAGESLGAEYPGQASGVPKGDTVSRPDFELDFSNPGADGTSIGAAGGGFSAGASAGAAAPAVSVTLQVDSRDIAQAAADGSRALGGLPFKVVGAR